MRTLVTYLLLVFGSLSALSAQDIPKKGVPKLVNVAPSEYDNKGKVWSIDTAPNGIAYMAADKGLLEFDGRTWKNYKGSDGITRSVLIKDDSLIYTGSDLDFGIWKRNKYREFEYRSLYPFKEELSGLNEEFWDIHLVNESILFVSASNIYIHKDDNLTKIPAPNRFVNSFNVGEEIYFIDEVEGLFKLNNLTLEHIFLSDENINLQIVGVYKEEDDLMIVTSQNGLYRYSTNNLSPVRNQLSEKLKTANVFSFELIDSSYLAFGTILDGLFIADLDGTIIHHINKNKGLQNNTVLSLHYSEAGKLWLSLDYGISFLDLNSPFTFFYDFRGEFGTGYSAIVKDGIFYLGTNQGLYAKAWNDLNNSTDFQKLDLIQNSEGQVWTIEIIDDETWIGHDRGLFVLEDKSLKKISERSGFWDVQSYREYLLAGTYNGISIFTKQRNEWKFLKQMELIQGSANQVIIASDNTLWVNIPNYGIIKAELNEDLYPENQEIFLSEQFGSGEHFLFQNRDGIHVKTETLSYSYSTDENRFSKTSSLESKQVIEGLLNSNARSASLNADYEFYPVYNGFAFKDLNVINDRKPDSYKLVIRSLEAFNNEVKQPVYTGSEIPFIQNNLKIESIVPNEENVLYQFKKSDSENWTNWSKENTYELINLDYGTHEISLRAKVDGINTATETVKITVAAPWYLTFYAIAIYTLILLLLIYSFYKWRQSSLRKLKKDLLISQQNSLREQADRYNERLKRVEEENLRLEYDQLKARLKNKTIELATKAKENEEINKVLEEIKEKFKKLEQNPASLKTRLKEIQNIVDSHLNSEDNTFEIQMDELHQQFFENLRNDFPDLTNYDLRLCAYIKLGFNSKEIANMLNIMPSSIYISRSRLRKKLNLDSDADLHGYLNSV